MRRPTGSCGPSQASWMGDGASGAPAHRRKDRGPEGSRLSFDKRLALAEASLCLAFPTPLWGLGERPIFWTGRTSDVLA